MNKEKLTDKNSAYFNDGRENYLDVNQEFFLIDSERLSEVETKMYGFSVRRGGVFEKANMTQAAAAELDGCGVYVYIERTFARGG